MPEKICRVRCVHCGDEIDRHLGPPPGWTSLRQERTHDESIAPPKIDEDLFDWITHDGLCPECTANGIEF